MNSFYFWDEMAAGHLKSDNFEEAIQAYKNALKSTTDCVQQAFVWANIGNIYLSLKNTPSAVDAFLSASLLDPASYDFDSILERITSSGCLDKTALVLAKDMYAKDVETISATAETSVEIAQEEIAPAAAELENVEIVAEVVAEPESVEAVSEEEISQPVAETEAIEAVAETEVAEVVAEPESVEAVSEEEISQPVAETEAIEAVAETEAAEVVAEAESVEAVSEEEISQPVAETEAIEAAAETEVTEVVAETESVEAVSEEEISQPAAEVVEIEDDEEADAVEIVAEIAGWEPVAVEDAGEIEEPIMTATEPVAESAPSEIYFELAIDEILASPVNLRASLQTEELVESIRQHGILQPLVVAKATDGKYVVVAGNRRLEAARTVGLETIPVVLRPADERELLEMALIENIQRVNLDPLELAEAYCLLSENFGMSLEAIAECVGKSRSAISNTINLLNLTDEGKQALQEKAINEGHARALVMIASPVMQNHALVYILENRLSVRQTDDLVRIIINAVAVSRTYDEPLEEEVFAEAIEQQEAESEALETEAAVEAELALAEVEADPEIIAEQEVEEFIAEVVAADPEPELEPVAVADELDAEIIPEVFDIDDQPVMIEAVEEVLTEESENAETIVEETAVEAISELTSEEVVAEEPADEFVWLESNFETVDEMQTTDIAVEAYEQTSVEEIEMPMTASAETILVASNSGATQDVTFHTDVMVAEPIPFTPIESVYQQTEEALSDLIEETVQFTDEVISNPVDSTVAVSDEQTAGDPAPVAQAEVTPEPVQPESKVDSPARLKALETIAGIKRLVEKNPDNVRIWHLLGNLYSDLGQYEEASDCLNRAIALDPNKYTYYYHLGLAMASARRYPEAIQALEKTVELAPQHVLAHCSLAGCYRHMDNATETRKHIEIGKPQLMLEKAYNRACFESICGNNDQALELLQVALNTDKIPTEWLFRDPDLDFIRDDPRFQALIAELGGSIL